MLHSMLDQKFLSEFQRIMNERDILHDKIAYFIETKIVQILSAGESFGHFDFLAFFAFLVFQMCTSLKEKELFL